ncbi:hypothetical protein EGJ48_22560 [Pantoea dispersa]|nr:hypothetical protein EGJ48_22560 [Pantoea dispersa]
MHTAQLGANCLNGTECQAWYEKTRPLTAERHRKTAGREQESARGSDPPETVGIFKSCRVSSSVWLEQPEIS